MEYAPHVRAARGGPHRVGREMQNMRGLGRAAQAPVVGVQPFCKPVLTHDDFLRRSSLIRNDFSSAAAHVPSHLLSAGPRATPAHQTNAAARGIGMLTSRAKVASC